MKQIHTAKIDPFQAIGDPSRRYMLQLLSKHSLTINALAENFEMSRPAVSKHLKLLSGAGLVTIRDIGRERHCSLNQRGFRHVQQWMQHFDQFWHVKLKTLDNLVKKQIRNSKQ